MIIKGLIMAPIECYLASLNMQVYDNYYQMTYYQIIHYHSVQANNK